MTFLSHEVVLYLHKSTIRPCIKYCVHIWSDTPSRYVEQLDKLKKRICRTVGSSLVASLEPLAHCRNRNVASLRHSYRYYFGIYSSDQAQLVPPCFSRGRSTRYSDRFIIPRCYKDAMSTVFPDRARPRNSLRLE